MSSDDAGARDRQIHTVSGTHLRLGVPASPGLYLQLSGESLFHILLYRLLRVLPIFDAIVS
jgi:hypothetical protein